MKLFEIRFHGRGGQGAVTGAKILGDATRLENKYFQAFAHYGAERRGAPVMAFTRVADEAIRIHSYIYDPETIVIDEEKALTWLRQGAQPTMTAARLLSKVGIIEKFKTIKEKT